MECLFCKIINDQIESKKIYEDEYVLAILDAFPISDGHVLVIPKNHHLDLTTMNNDEIIYLMNAIKKVHPQLISMFL